MKTNTKNHIQPKGYKENYSIFEGTQIITKLVLITDIIGHIKPLFKFL